MRLVSSQVLPRLTYWNTQLPKIMMPLRLRNSQTATGIQNPRNSGIHWETPEICPQAQPQTLSLPTVHLSQQVKAQDYWEVVPFFLKLETFFGAFQDALWLS